MNDPAALRWIAVAVYAIGAMMVWRAAAAAPRRDHKFWRAASGTLVVLGAAKAVHLQRDVTGMLRNAAKAGGWYDWHKDAQTLFGLVVAAALILCGGLLAKYLGRSGVPVKIAAAGLAALLAFLALRTGSSHAIDSWVVVRAAGIPRGWWAELVAIVVISGSAMASWNRRKRSGRTAR